MKNKTLLLSLLALGIGAVGCDQKTTTSQKIDQLQAETTAAVQDLKEQDYTYAQ